MCSVSMVTNDWLHRQNINIPGPTWEQFNQIMSNVHELRAEVEKLKVELRAAREKDIAENAADCEMQEKVELVRKIAEAVGVDLGDVFDGHK